MGRKSRSNAAIAVVFATAMIATSASWSFAAGNPVKAASSCADLGTSWTSQSSAADNEWFSITWGGPTGQEKFVAVARSGTGNRVMTSPDGVTWTTRTSAADNNWVSVTWGGPTGQEKFVAVAWRGAANRVMTSPDGVTWTTQTSAANNDWVSVTWGGPTGQEKLVAVAFSGTGDRVMTSSCPPQSSSPAPVVSLHHGSLDPNVGSCRMNGTAMTTSTRTPFLGYTYIPGAEECSRPGFTFQGWAIRTKPATVYALPLLRGWDDGVWRYFIADTFDLIAVWKTIS